MLQIGSHYEQGLIYEKDDPGMESKKSGTKNSK